MSQLIIQPSSADNWLEKYASSSNHGSVDELFIRNSSSATDRILLEGNFSALPNYTQITQALLELYYHSYTGNNPVGLDVRARRLTQAGWTELGSTWDKYDGTNNWTTAGGDSTSNDAATATIPASFGWMSWDVTNQIIYAQENVSKIAHFLIKYVNEDGSGSYARFYSNDYTTDTTKCPKLILTYRYKNGLWFGNG